MPNIIGSGQNISYKDRDYRKKDEMIGYILRKLHDDLDINMNYKEATYILNIIKKYEEKQN